MNTVKQYRDSAGGLWSEVRPGLLRLVAVDGCPVDEPAIWPIREIVRGLGELKEVSR